MKRILAAGAALAATGCASDDLEMWANGLSMAAAEMEAEANYCPPGTYRTYGQTTSVNPPLYPNAAYPYSTVSTQPASWCAPSVYVPYDDDRGHRDRGRKHDDDYRYGYRDGYKDGRRDDRD